MSIIIGSYFYYSNFLKIVFLYETRFESCDIGVLRFRQHVEDIFYSFWNCTLQRWNGRLQKLACSMNRPASG